MRSGFGQPMKIHQLSVEDALRRLRSKPEGLSSEEALRRLREFGPNRVERIARESVWLRLFREFTRFFSAILWADAGLAFFTEWSDPGQGMARIGYAIIVVILVSGLFSLWQEYRVERTLDALQKLLPQRNQVLRNNDVAQLPAEDLVVGDVVLLEQGDNVPADCRLIDAFDVRVHNAEERRVGK